MAFPNLRKSQLDSIHLRINPPSCCNGLDPLERQEEGNRARRNGKGEKVEDEKRKKKRQSHIHFHFPLMNEISNFQDEESEMELAVSNPFEKKKKLVHNPVSWFQFK